MKIKQRTQPSNIDKPHRQNNPPCKAHAVLSGYCNIFIAHVPTVTWKWSSRYCRSVLYGVRSSLDSSSPASSNWGRNTYEISGILVTTGSWLIMIPGPQELWLCVSLPLASLSSEAHPDQAPLLLLPSLPLPLPLLLFPLPLLPQLPLWPMNWVNTYIHVMDWLGVMLSNTCMY